MKERTTIFRSRFTPQFAATRYGQSQLLELDTLANLDRFGWVTLHQRVEDTQVDVVHLLIDNGADVGARTDTGSTALHLAAKGKKTSLVELLIHSGANVNAKRNDGENLLHSAMDINTGGAMNIFKHTDDADIADITVINDIIRILLENGAYINAMDNRGETALHLAAGKKMDVVVQHLIERGSYVRAEDNCGQTPLHYAVLRIGSKFQTCENMGCPYASIPQHRPNCNIDGDESDGTDDESEEGDVERVLQILLEHDANFNLRDMKGYTALHLAAGERDSLVVELLLQRGAEVNVVDNHGQRPLHLAIDEPGKTGFDFYWKDDGEPAVHMLLDHGARYRRKG